MRFLFIVLFCLAGARSAHAEVIAALGTGFTFEYGADGRTLESRTPLALRGGYRFPQLDLFLEYQTYRSSSGSGQIFVSREHQEYLLWGRKIFVPEWRVSPYVSGGLGFSYEVITTTFGSQTAKDAGTPQFVLAGATGARTLFWKTLELAAEARVGFSQTYNPDPMFALLLLIGVQF